MDGKRKNGNNEMVEGHRLLIAGGNWNNGTNCSSRYRNLNNYRWNANSNIGVQAVTQIQWFTRVISLAGFSTLFVSYGKQNIKREIG
jgi:hypothetical protein